MGELGDDLESKGWFDHPHVGRYGPDGILINGFCDSEEIPVEMAIPSVEDSTKTGVVAASESRVGLRPGRPSGVGQNAAEVVRLRRDGKSFKEIAAILGVTPVTLSRWRKAPQLQDIFGLIEIVDHGNKPIVINYDDVDVLAAEELLAKLLKRYTGSEIRLRRK